MTTWSTGLTAWLIDFYLLSSVILLAFHCSSHFIKQPARRVCLAWWTTFGLLGIAATTALPAWPRISLTEAPQRGDRDQSRPTLAEPMPVAVNRTNPVQDAAADQPAADPRQNDPLAASATAPSGELSTAAEDEPRSSGVRSIAEAVGSVYAAGSTAVAFWLLLGAMKTTMLCRAAEPAPHMLNEVINRLTWPRKAPPILLSSHISVPVALGTFRPTIILPMRFAERASERSIRAALAHESAHIRDRDLWFLALSRFLLVVLYAHPLFWWFRRIVSDDQEAVADAAAAGYSNRHDYAADLCQLVRDMAFDLRHNRPASALAIWERPSQLSRRVARLVDERTFLETRPSGRWVVASLLFVVSLCLCCSVVTVRPQAASAAERPKERDVEQGSNDQIIAGKCLDETGEPLSDVPVDLYLIDWQKDIRRLLQATKTGADGTFRFGIKDQQPRDAEQRYYQLVAHRKGRATAMWGIGGAAGSHELTMPPAAAVRGRVTDPDGRPIPDALVHFNAPFPPLDGFHNARTDRDGHFEVTDLAPFAGNERMRASGRGGYGSVRRFRVEHPDFAATWVPYNAIPTEVEIVMDPAAVITGHVVYGTTGEPAAGVRVACQAINGQENRYSSTARTDEQGRYRLQSLPAGAYNIWAEHPQWTIKALDSFTVQTGEHKQAPELEFIQGGFIKGQLLNALTREPVTQAPDDRTHIGLYGPSRPRSGAAIEYTLVEEDGSFSIRVAPGENYVYFTDPGPWHVVEPTSYTVKVADGETVEVEFFVTRRQSPAEVDGDERDVPDEAPQLEAWKQQWQKEKPAIAAITELGGWVETEPSGPYETVVEVNMVYHYTDNNERLDNNQVTDEALYYVPKFKNLKRLLLKQGQASDEALAHIRGMQHLERIYLWDAHQVTDDGVVHLATLPSLKYLHLSNSRISDKSLEHLSVAEHLWTQLEGLSLQGNTFSDRALDHLSVFVNLKGLHLGLGKSGITDAGLEKIVALQSLEVLDLQGSLVTDEGLVHLTKLPFLREIWLSNTKVTPEGIKKLQKLLPNVKISH